MKDLNCINNLNYLFDKRSHVLHINSISLSNESILVELSNSTKNFKIEDYSSIEDLLEKICTEYAKADDWRNN